MRGPFERPHDLDFIEFAGNTNGAPIKVDDIRVWRSVSQEPDPSNAGADHLGSALHPVRPVGQKTV